uniref:DNA-binding protein K10 n=1 Tax=Anopheles gambiae TaxID=7165 RepID=A0A1S4HD75_ANOGA
MVSNKAQTSEGNKRVGNQMANRPRFKPAMAKQYNPMSNMRNMNAMFNANQLGDDPGFVDFNDDSITAAPNGTGGPNAAGAATSNGLEGGGIKNGPFANGNRRMNPPMKRPMKNGGMPGMRNRMNGGANGMPSWGPPMPPPNMFPGPPSAGRRGPMNPPPIPPPVPPAHFRSGPGMRMRGPQNGRFGVGGPPGPMSLMNRPLPPPIPPMAGRPMPPPMGRMMPPPLRHGGLDGPMRRNMNGGGMHARGMGGKMGPFARNGMPPGGGTGVGPNGKRARPKPTQPPNREEYPLDKPWVTEEIKAEHDKKADLANRLKGHRDDELFAQFKMQRDKFVKMYEAARLEYIGKHPEQDVDKILTAPACKKARTENVEKSNAPTVSADSTAKTEGPTSSTSTTDPTDSQAKSDTNGSASSATIDSCTSNTTNASSATATAASSDTNDTTESAAAEPQACPVAAPVENSAIV